MADQNDDAPDDLEAILSGKAPGAAAGDGDDDDAGHDPELDGAEGKPGKPKAKPAGDDFADEGLADDDEVPAREDGESDEDYAARLEAAGLDPAEHIKPAVADDDAGDDDELDADGKATREKLTPELQKRFDREIGKKVAKVKAAEAVVAERDKRIAELEAAAAAQPGATARPTAEDPLADVETEAELVKRIEGAKAWRSWLRTHPEGGTLGEGDAAQEVTPEQARAWLIHYEDLLSDHAPARRDYLKQRDTADAEAVKVHAWLGTKTHPGAVEIEAHLRKHPQLRNVSGIRLVLADAYVTRTARAKAKADAAAGKGGDGKTVKKAPINPGASGQRPAKMVSGKPAAKATRRLEESGEDPDNAALRNEIFPGGGS